jgi:Tfp pilus assembly protein PilN
LRLERLAADEAAAVENRIKELTGKIQTLEKEKNTLTNKGGLYEILNFIASQLPAGAFINDIEINPQGITLAGRTEERLDIITFAGSLEKQGQFTSVRIASIGELTDAASDNQRESFAFRVIIVR